LFDEFFGRGDAFAVGKVQVGVGGAVFRPVGAGALAAEGALGDEGDLEAGFFPVGDLLFLRGSGGGRGALEEGQEGGGELEEGEGGLEVGVGGEGGVAGGGGLEACGGGVEGGGEVGEDAGVEGGEGVLVFRRV
jgi:hypothetical protein